MFEHSYWVTYLCIAVAWSVVGIALLAHRAGLPQRLDTFPYAATGFVGTGAVSALLAAVTYSRGSGQALLAIVVLAGLLTPLIGWVVSLFAPTNDGESAPGNH